MKALHCTAAGMSVNSVTKVCTSGRNVLLIHSGKYKQKKEKLKIKTKTY